MAGGLLVIFPALCEHLRSQQLRRPPPSNIAIHISGLQYVLVPRGKGNEASASGVGIGEPT